MDTTETAQAIETLLMDAAAIADALTDQADSGDTASIDRADIAAQICALIDQLNNA